MKDWKILINLNIIYDPPQLYFKLCDFLHKEKLNQSPESRLKLLNRETAALSVSRLLAAGDQKWEEKANCW